MDGSGLEMLWNRFRISLELIWVNLGSVSAWEQFVIALDWVCDGFGIG